MPAERLLLLTCEHGGNRVPARYAPLFAGRRRLLASHRALDLGALAAARALRQRLGVPLIAATTTRLLVDLNRSPGHRRWFSEITRELPKAERQRIVARHYEPYRARVRERLSGWIASGRVALHVSVHSFTPRLDGERRRCDIGLLYDPARPLEVAWADAWARALRTRAPSLVVRRNYPYRGIADGLVTRLRRELPRRAYAGIELEINQAWTRRSPADWRRLMADLAATLPR